MLDVIQEDDTRGEGKSRRRTGSARITKEQEMVSLDVLNHVKINVMQETSISSLKNAFSQAKSRFLFNKKELRDAERKLKQAFIEFHQKLRHLKSYSFLNQLAFSKIMKKYDKSTSRNASKAYLDMVEKSYLKQSDEVAKLMESVETVFIEHFSNGNRGLGMKMLRQKAKTDRHRVTFFTGFSLALIVTIIIMIHVRKLLKSNGRDKYMTNVVLSIAFCPFDIVYRTSGFFLITCIWHCICTPLYKVTLPDFFMADQLTSQVQLFRNLQFYICYYGWGDYKTRESTECRASSVHNNISLVIAIIPYLIRCLQCLRRLFDGEDSSQAVNAGKYFSTIVAVVARTFYVQEKGMTLKMVALSTSIVATIYGTYWDLVCDWGLLRRNSQNPRLRDKLLLPHRSIYFLAMVVNVILRLAWMQTVFDFHEAPVNDDAQRIRLVSMHVFDKALNWHKQFIKRFGENVTWERYEAELKARFDSVFKDPMVELKNLTQTTSVQVYQDLFESLMNKVELIEPYAISLFNGGLKEEI
nr:phosphate transporter PHO1 homolog 9-like isoform X2 [Tanacetum cinerariifolium]